MRWFGKTFLVILLILSMNLSWLAFKVPLAQASPGTQIKTIEVPIYQYAANVDDTDIAASESIKSGTYATSHNTGQYTSQAFYNSIPYIAYYDVTMDDLKFVKCGNDTCSSGNTISTVDGAMVKDGSVEADVGQYTSLQVISGTPYISYYDVTNADLKFVKCGNDTCSSGNTISIIDSTGDVGQYTSLQVVSSIPYISYYDATNTALKFVKCGDDTCDNNPANTISTVDNTENDGQYNSLQIVSGIPYISYYDATNTALKFVKCGDDTCDNNPANTISTIDSTDNVGRYPSLQVINGIPYISYQHETQGLPPTIGSLKFVKCGDDTCDNNPANTISTVVSGGSDNNDLGIFNSLQLVSGIPYISYIYVDTFPTWYLKFVKCGDDTCDNNPANTINSVDSTVPGTDLGTYNSFQLLSGIPYISYYDGTNDNLKFVKCGDDTCDNSPANTFNSPSTGGFGAGFHLDIPESSVTVRYAYVEWRTIMSANNTTCGLDACQIDFAREESTTAYNLTGTINANSAESQPLVIRTNVTSQIAAGFYTYYFDAQLDIARNTDSAKLIVTYEYDDASVTQTKTVRYPLPTKETQSAAPSSDLITSTLNPNLQEANISIQKAWIEMTGQVSAGATDIGVSVLTLSSTWYSVGTTSLNRTMIDGDNKTTMDFVSMYEPTKVVASGATDGQLNYNASNSIYLKNITQVMNLKGGELIITYNYSYYDTTNTTHRNTVRYFVGQLLGQLSTSYAKIGAPTVYLPESTLSNYNVYLKVVGTNVAAAATRYCVLIASSDGANCTGGTEYPSASTYYDTVVSEQASRDVIFIDISSNFNTNWSNGYYVRVWALGDTNSETYAVGAELIISYNFVIPTGSGTFTNIKTVDWFIAQQTAKGTTSLTGTFNTYIPESSTTYRSSAAIGDYVISNTAAPELQVDVYVSSSSTTSVISSSTGENVTYSAMEQGGFTAATQTGLNYQIHACTPGSCTTGFDTLKGMTAYTTYEVSAPKAPELALIFIFIAPFLPKIVEWRRRRKLDRSAKVWCYDNNEKSNFSYRLFSSFSSRYPSFFHRPGG